LTHHSDRSIIEVTQLSATTELEQHQKLRFLGKVTDGGNSPTLFDTDEIMFGREVFVIQGWKITDSGALATLNLPDHETAIAVPKELMRYLPKENSGAAD